MRRAPDAYGAVRDKRRELTRTFSPGAFAKVFADPEQPSLWSKSLAGVRTMLVPLR